MAQSIFSKYKSVFRFLLIFLGVYIGFFLLYQVYIKISAGAGYFPDYITHKVAIQSNALVNDFGYQGDIKLAGIHPVLQMHVNSVYVGRIIEGCNAVSIMILFTAFVLSFWQGFKKTLAYLLAGIALIYAVNVLRIAVLSIGLYHYPEKEALLHGTLFPAAIYSMVFLLWVIWIRSIKKPKANA